MPPLILTRLHLLLHFSAMHTVCTVHCVYSGALCTLVHCTVHCRVQCTGPVAALCIVLQSTPVAAVAVGCSSHFTEHSYIVFQPLAASLHCSACNQIKHKQCTSTSIEVQSSRWSESWLGTALKYTIHNSLLCPSNIL